MDERIENANPNLNYFDAHIMHVIAPSANMGMNAAHMYGSRIRNRNNVNQAHYSRLFLLRIISPEGVENDRLYYVMDACNTNTSLWDRNVELCDNRAVTMGMIVRILAPLPIHNLMSGYLPMSETQFPMVMMWHPQVFNETPINYKIQGKSEMDFVQNGITITVNCTLPEETAFSGLFCDIRNVSMIGWSSKDVVVTT